MGEVSFVELGVEFWDVDACHEASLACCLEFLAGLSAEDQAAGQAAPTAILERAGQVLAAGEDWVDFTG